MLPSSKMYACGTLHLCIWKSNDRNEMLPYIFTDLKSNKRRDQMNFSGIIDGWSLEFTQQVWVCAIWLYFIFWGRWTVYPWQLVLPALDPKSISNQNTLPRLLTQFMKRRPQYAWSGLISKLGFEIAGPRTPVWHRFSSFVWLNSCPTFRPSLRIESFFCKLETTSIDYFCFLPKIQLIPLNVRVPVVCISMLLFLFFLPFFLTPIPWSEVGVAKNMRWQR